MKKHWFRKILDDDDDDDDDDYMRKFEWLIKKT